jgi:cell division protein FtsL
MKNAAKVLFLLAIILFIAGEIFGFKVSVMEKKIKGFSEEYFSLQNNNRILKVQYQQVMDLSRIEFKAKTKLKMLYPDSYIIIEVNNGK